MKFDETLKRREGESAEAYLVRIASQRERQNLTWQDVTDICNDQLGLDHAESTYRKKYTAFERLFAATGGGSTGEMLEQLREERRELYKARTLLRDERNEYNRILREQARQNDARDAMIKAIAEHAPVLRAPRPPEGGTVGQTGAMAVMVSDMHYGMSQDNAAGAFSPEMAWGMISQYAAQILGIQERHKARECHVLLGGDIVSGIIHTALRVEASRNVIEQVMGASNAIAWMVNVLSRKFAQVHVHGVTGNHGRVTPRISDGIAGENFDALIPYYLKKALGQNERVTVHEPVNPTLDVFDMAGRHCALVHGNNDRIETIGMDIAPMAGMTDYIFYGHVHNAGMYPARHGGKVIVNGSFVGVDTYAFENRYFVRPEQVVLVLGDDGVDSLCRCTLTGGEKK